jgi:glycosyltransferase involved in cell wall biosynthesis
MSRPLIAIFCNSFPPEGGAASQRMAHLANLLLEAGYQVEVVSSMPNYPQGRIFNDYKYSLNRLEIIDGISVQRCWLYASNSRSAFPRALSLLSQRVAFRRLAFRRIRKLRPELVIVSSPPLPMASAAVSYFRKAGVPVLLNVSDLWPLSARALGAARENQVYGYLQKLEHRMYRQASAFSGQSQAILDHIAAVTESPRPAFLLRNLPPPLTDAVPDAGIHTDRRLRIIYPGLLGHAQGISALITGLNWQLLPASLDIYGAGAEEPEIAHMLQQDPGLPVKLRQQVSETRLREILPEYDAVLVPLVSHIPGALPSKLYTALHAGLPVLYSGEGEAAELVTRHGLGIASPAGDYEALAGAIRELAARPAEARQALRTHILQTAQALFDRPTQDAALLAFTRALITKTENG